MTAIQNYNNTALLEETQAYVFQLSLEKSLKGPKWQKDQTAVQETYSKENLDTCDTITRSEYWREGDLDFVRGFFTFLSFHHGYKTTFLFWQLRSVLKYHNLNSIFGMWKNRERKMCYLLYDLPENLHFVPSSQELTNTQELYTTKSWCS